MATELGLTNQLFVLNRGPEMKINLPQELPKKQLQLPIVDELVARQLFNPSVVSLDAQSQLDPFIERLLDELGAE